MSIEHEYARSEQSGIGIQKDKLLALLKSAGVKLFPIYPGKKFDFVLIKLAKLQ